MTNPPAPDPAPVPLLQGPPTVTAGHITALRLFDVANSIDLGQAEGLWAQQARAGGRARLSATPPKAVAFSDPPLSLILPPVPLALGTATLEAVATARVYAFGVVSLALRVPTDGLAWADLAARMSAMHGAIGMHANASVWPTMLQMLLNTIGRALDRPNRSTLAEDYLVATVHAFDRPVPATALGSTIDLAPLLSGETRPLAESARADLLARRFSYYTDDLVVLTWDRAFIYEPRRDTDVADVIEVANAQFLEMRYYDELLDAELPRMFSLVEGARRIRLSPNRYARLARRLYTLVAEVTQLTEKVDNALQVTEDVYLARVYAAALDLFRVKLLSAAVDRKLSIIRDTYAAMYDEAASARTWLMEAAVIVLILVEIIVAVLQLRG